MIVLAVVLLKADWAYVIAATLWQSLETATRAWVQGSGNGRFEDINERLHHPTTTIA
jgi:hypothetical protein